MFNEKYGEAYEGRGDALQEIAKIEKDPSKLSLSITNYEEAFSLKPDLDYVYGKIVSTKMYVNDWSKTEEYLSKIKEEVNNSKTMFKKYNWPIIDVTRKSVEETAASVIKIYDIMNAK